MVIAPTEIVMAMILGWIFLHERVSLRFWIGVLLLMVGVKVMKSEGLSIPTVSLFPVLWAFGCALAFALI